MNQQVIDKFISDVNIQNGVNFISDEIATSLGQHLEKLSLPEFKDNISYLYERVKAYQNTAMQDAITMKVGQFTQFPTPEHRLFFINKMTDFSSLFSTQKIEKEVNTNEICIAKSFIQSSNLNTNRDLLITFSEKNDLKLRFLNEKKLGVLNYQTEYEVSGTNYNISEFHEDIMCYTWQQSNKIRTENDIYMSKQYLSSNKNHLIAYPLTVTLKIDISEEFVKRAKILAAGSNVIVKDYSINSYEKGSEEIDFKFEGKEKDIKVFQECLEIIIQEYNDKKLPKLINKSKKGFFKFFKK